MQSELAVEHDSWQGQHLTFTLGPQSYSIHMKDVIEINRLQDITPIPNTPVWVRGVINLRGHVIPVVDLRQKLGLDSIAYDSRTCIIVVLEDEPVGLVVDRIGEVLVLPSDSIEQAVPTIGSRCLKGIARRADGTLTMIIDPRSIMGGGATS